jgi:hypothetical protein
MKKLMLTTTLMALTCTSGAFAGNGVLSQELINIARKSLASIQNQSFQSQREYCGLIGRTTAGELIVSPARRGRSNGCDERGFSDRTITPVASYHTHGGYHEDADSEVPSTMDVDMDHHHGVFGFVATPGGRFWVIDHRSRTAKQICGMGCLPSDPMFDKGMAGDIPKHLTRRQMAQREGKGGPRHLRARAHRHAKN